MTADSETGRGKFGVIVCPDCKAAKVVDLTDKTSGCHRCGKRLVLKKMRVYYRTDSRKEARWAIGRVNAEMSGGEMPEEEEEKESDDPHVKASRKAEVAENERERLSIISRVLCEEMGSFGIEDINKVYDLLGREIEDLETKLKRMEEIYEKEEGVFRSV
ncbi:MAG: hypothetical protein V5A88_05340 [Candidatus Thermoplasmatota archaeon]